MSFHKGFSAKVNSGKFKNKDKKQRILTILTMFCFCMDLALIFEFAAVYFSRESFMKTHLCQFLMMSLSGRTFLRLVNFREPLCNGDKSHLRNLNFLGDQNILKNECDFLNLHGISFQTSYQTHLKVAPHFFIFFIRGNT